MELIIRVTLCCCRNFWFGILSNRVFTDHPVRVVCFILAVSKRDWFTTGRIIMTLQSFRFHSIFYYLFFHVTVRNPRRFPILQLAVVIARYSSHITRSVYLRSASNCAFAVVTDSVDFSIL